MQIEIEYIFIALIALLWIDVFIVLRTLSNKAELSLSRERRTKELSELAHLFEVDTEWDKKKVRRLFDNYLRLKQSIDLPAHEKEMILKLAKAEKILPKLMRRIHSRSRYTRMEAAMGLALIGNETSRLSLEGAMATERDYPVKLYIANALADIGDPRAIRPMAESLLGSHRWYRDKVNMLIATFGVAASDYLRGYMWSRDNEIIELLVDVAGSCVCEDLKEYLLNMLLGADEERTRLKRSVRNCPDKSCAYCVHGRKVNEDFTRTCRFEGTVQPDFRCRRFSLLITSRDPAFNHRRILIKAAEVLEKFYAPELDRKEFLENEDRDIRSIAIRSLGMGNSETAVKSLIKHAGDEDAASSAKIGLSRILSAHSKYVPLVVDAFEMPESRFAQQRLAEVLAGRIEYFIAKLASRDRPSSERLIRELIGLEKVTELIEFLKLNKNPMLEDILASIIIDEAPENERLREECGIYLPDHLLKKFAIPKITYETKREPEKRDKKMIKSLYFILAFALLFFPFLYLTRHSDTILAIPFWQQIRTYVVEMNFDFGYYSIFVNLGYLTLMLLSIFKARSSSRLWNLKTMSLLFKPRMLPSVSILAPAYNEERTIIESVNSLLNLKYPDYELIVVNDGSKDGTLATLVANFGLKRTDYYYTARLKTASVRGIYANPLYPRLLVVDKENGGKADTLNAGINVATKEYFCGIDADSLLEAEALLIVASHTLDHGVETPGLGGNVFPINGCRVDRGKLMQIALPRNKLAMLQTIEYLRAFMCGRMGWAQLNSLLIISGAFGLFRKERVVSVGGYLTSSERYQKNTVGEDMELVVRIARLMREKKQKYRMSYAFNANCWTEVPESIDILKRQRDRWHRGLIDIMFFHRKVLFNPTYGRMGMLGMPYFLIFEMIGPLFEIQGYISVALAAVFGLISTKLAMLLFLSTILMGVVISMGSVLIAERQLTYFNMRDTLKMLAIALVENFGPRQIFSMWRVLGFFSAMRSPKGWGKMERKGFGPAQTPVPASAAVQANGASK
jgi:cellulose synthase/poly-beta-1,6-N-acetylglucosamine synthase-like glycosyltransferase